MNKFQCLQYILTLVLLTVLLGPFNDAFGDSVDGHEQDRARLIQVIEAVGVVRYFHPHEAVTVVDWNRVLHDGFDLAIDSDDDAAFSASLAEMLGAIGSGITHNPADQPDTLSCPSSERPVRWVHEGLGAAPAAGRHGPYSIHLAGAKGQQVDTRAHAIVLMKLDAADWRGKQLLYEGQARVPNGGKAALWIRVDDADRKILAFYNMDDRLFESADWASRGLVVPVANQAAEIYMGMIVYGDVSADFRNVKLQVYDQRAEKPIGESLLPVPDQWQLTPVGAEFELDSSQTSDGAAASITGRPSAIEPSHELLAQLDKAPASWTIDLLDGSRLDVPIALCPEQAALEPTSRERLLNQFAPIEVASLSPSAKARLDVATLWPVMQHFYPYRDKLDGWPEALALALEQAELVEDRKAQRRLLQRLLTAVEDGHVNVNETDRGLVEEIAWLPISALNLDGKLIITGVEGRSAGVRTGDRVVRIDGEPVDDWLEQARSLHSGSAHWRNHRAIQAMLVGDPGSRRSFQLERDGQMVEARLRFGRDRQLEPFGPGIAPTMPDGIAYVDLRGLNDEQWAERLPGLLDAQGVVFDLRGYPGSAGTTMLGHLLATKDDFTAWMEVLTPREPEGELVTAGAFEWGMEPAEPRIEASTVFLTDQRAISYSESVLGVVKFNQLGTIVGSNTAGANGNVLTLMLPGAFTVFYTGMLVLGPDGETIHGRGIEPDILVYPTAEGVRDGRDEVVERGVEHLLNDLASNGSDPLE